MTTVGARIKQRRQQLGLSVEEVAARLGKNRATVYRYESNEIENLPLTIIEPLAKALDVSPAYLMGWEGIMDYETKKVPMLGVAEEACDYYAEVTKSTPVDFCLKVADDSMSGARIESGDLVFIHKQGRGDVKSGEIIAVSLEGETVLRRFYKNDGLIMLKPESLKYQPLMFTSDDFKSVRVLGKAMFFQGLL